MRLKYVYMSVAMLTSAGAVLDAIGVPRGLGSKSAAYMESGVVSFDDELRSQYLNQIGGILKYKYIELRKFTIFTSDETVMCLARILSIASNPNKSTLRVVIGSDDTHWYTVESIQDNECTELSWSENSIFKQFDKNFLIESMDTTKLCLTALVKLNGKEDTSISIELKNHDTGITWGEILAREHLPEKIDSFFNLFDKNPCKLPEGYPEFSITSTGFTLSSKSRDLLLMGELVSIEGVHPPQWKKTCRICVGPISQDVYKIEEVEMELTELKKFIKGRKLFIESIHTTKLSLTGWSDRDNKICFQLTLSPVDSTTCISDVKRRNLLNMTTSDLSSIADRNGKLYNIKTSDISVSFKKRTFNMSFNFMDCDASDATITIHEKLFASLSAGRRISDTPYLRVIKAESSWFNLWEEIPWSRFCEYTNGRVAMKHMKARQGEITIILENNDVRITAIRTMCCTNFFEDVSLYREIPYHAGTLEYFTDHILGSYTSNIDAKSKSDIQMRIFTIKPSEGRGPWVACMASINNSEDINTLQCYIGMSVMKQYSVKSIRSNKQNDISWKRVYYMFEGADAYIDIKDDSGLFMSLRGNNVIVEFEANNNEVTSWSDILSTNDRQMWYEMYYSSFPSFRFNTTYSADKRMTRKQPIVPVYPISSVEAKKLTLMSTEMDFICIAELIHFGECNDRESLRYIVGKSRKNQYKISLIIHKGEEIKWDKGLLTEFFHKSWVSIIDITSLTLISIRDPLYSMKIVSTGENTQSKSSFTRQHNIIDTPYTEIKDYLEINSKLDEVRTLDYGILIEFETSTHTVCLHYLSHSPDAALTLSTLNEPDTGFRILTIEAKSKKGGWSYKRWTDVSHSFTDKTFQLYFKDFHTFILINEFMRMILKPPPDLEKSSICKLLGINTVYMEKENHTLPNNPDLHNLSDPRLFEACIQPDLSDDPAAVVDENPEN